MRVRSRLCELTGVHLMAEDIPGRFTFHDLLRAYAIEQNQAHDGEADRQAAIHRLLDHYLNTACAAATVLAPQRDPIVPPPPQPGVGIADPPGYDQALAWFAAEHQVLLRAIELADRAGFDGHVLQLAWTLTVFLDRRGHWHDMVTAGLAALTAAHRLDDRLEQARSHRYLARAYLRLDRLDDAQAHLIRALELCGTSADRVGLADTHLRLSQVLERRGRYAAALTHAVETLRLFRATGRRPGQGVAHHAFGWYQTLLGEHTQALASCGRALPLLRKLGDRLGQADTWHTIGYARQHLGHRRQAIASYRRAIRLYRALGDRYDEAATLTYLGNAHEAFGAPEQARTAWRRALTMLDELNHPESERVRAKLACRAQS